MWLRLSYLSLRTAFNRSIVDGRQMKPNLSGRYKGVLKKQFYINGLPWIYDLPKTNDLNPRNKRPKGHKKDLAREERVDKIKNYLANYANEELKYRQERLNNRPLRGLDRIVQKMMPSWISNKKIEMKGLKRRVIDEDEDEPGRAKRGGRSAGDFWDI